MKISFPQMSDYNVPIERFLKAVLREAQVVSCPITNRTIELGTRHSPDFVCSPFKYNLGNFIEALDRGAEVLFHAGGGCRFGYYGELLEQILIDLGYDFRFVNLFEADRISPRSIHKKLRELGSKKSLASIAYQLVITMKMIRLMDEIDAFMRENMGFEVNENDFDNLRNSLLEELKSVNSLRALKRVSESYWRRFRAIELSVPNRVLRVGIIGELFNLMEPFANQFIERELAKSRIAVTRFTNASYLLFGKKKQEKSLMREAAGYLSYEIGADGTLSVAKGSALARAGYDGLIHVKPFGCTPEVNAMPMLQNINKKHNIPILYFSFDCLNSAIGVKTRLEAFTDMLHLKNTSTKKEG